MTNAAAMANHTIDCFIAILSFFAVIDSSTNTAMTGPESNPRDLFREYAMGRRHDEWAHDTNVCAERTTPSGVASLRCTPAREGAALVSEKDASLSLSGRCGDDLSETVIHHVDYVG